MTDDPERMPERDLMILHADTLFTHDPAGRMVRVNEPNGKIAPRWFIGRTIDGSVYRLRNDVEDDIARELLSVCCGEPLSEEFLVPPYGADRYSAILAGSAPIQKQETGPTYSFPRSFPGANSAVPITSANADVLRPHLQDWLEDVAVRPLMFACLHQGRAVSVCCSVRTTPCADEAGVETAPGYRGHGYAAQVVVAWATEVRGQGRIPLYSTSWGNAASQAIARKLGLRRYGATVHIT
jgi:hypothetical protein